MLLRERKVEGEGLAPEARLEAALRMEDEDDRTSDLAAAAVAIVDLRNEVCEGSACWKMKLKQLLNPSVRFSDNRRLKYGVVIKFK